MVALNTTLMAQIFALVVQNFDSRSPDELTLRVGERVKIVYKHENGWWIGDNCGRVGNFPYYCVKEINEFQANSPPVKPMVYS